MTQQLGKPGAAHTVADSVLQGRVCLTLVGAGGNGSKVLTGLGCLHHALVALGRSGLAVSVYDPDIVTSANVGRQMFSPADVGQYKALALVQRVNMFFGTDWRAYPQRYEGPTRQHAPARGGATVDVLITCVDTAQTRAMIHRVIEESPQYAPRYWLDMGNDKTFGQVVLGEPNRYTPREIQQAQTRFARAGEHETPENREAWEAWAKVLTPRLPTITERSPELLAGDYVETDTPSCSLAEALGRQDLFINSHVADWALHLLWTMLKQGWIAHHGYVINLESGRVNPIPVPKAKES